MAGLIFPILAELAYPDVIVDLECVYTRDTVNAFGGNGGSEILSKTAQFVAKNKGAS